MATRQREREQLRERRTAKEEEAKRRQARLGRVYALAGVLAITAVVAVVLLVSSAGNSPSSAEAAFGQHYDGLADRMEAAKVPTMMETMSSSSHFHPHLLVYANGKQVEVPVNIGIDPTQPSMQMAGLHTHDTKGTIHDEGMPSSHLGQFFAVWGVPFSPTRLGPYKADGNKTVRMWVDGKPSQAFGNLALKDDQQIVVAYGTPRQLAAAPR